MTNTRTTARAEGFRIGARAQELILAADRAEWAGTVLADLLTGMYERADVDQLATVIELVDRIEESTETATAAAERAISATLATACPRCDQPAGEPCISRTGKRSLPHSGRVKAGRA